MNKRDTVKKIKAGSVEIGGGAPVSVQTMCNTKTWDVDATVAQIKAMQTAGADIVRIALPDMESAKAVSAIKEQVSVPLVADIHFDYRLAAETFDYPLHLGVTETGTEWNGTIQSAVGIGTLLCEGIGNTIRGSLTADPVKEVSAGIAIVKAAGLRPGGVRFVSCPTCGRTEIDLISLATEVEKRVGKLDRDITVAVMGCVVNGPGEAREADYGIAGGKGKGLLFKKGQVLGTYPYEELCDRLLDLINSDGTDGKA